MYTEILALDANFRMSRKAVSSKGKDPSLTNGYGYFVDSLAFEAHLEAHKGERQEVHLLLLKKLMILMLTKINKILAQSMCLA